jgi:hypothetical protein
VLGGVLTEGKGRSPSRLRSRTLPSAWWSVFSLLRLGCGWFASPCCLLLLSGLVFLSLLAPLLGVCPFADGVFAAGSGDRSLVAGASACSAEVLSFPFVRLFFFSWFLLPLLGRPVFSFAPPQLVPPCFSISIVVGYLYKTKK